MGVIVEAEGSKQVNHPTKKCPPLWGNLADLREVTNQGF